MSPQDEMILETMIRQQVETQLSRFRLSGDKEIGVRGHWPNFNIDLKREVQQPGGAGGFLPDDPIPLSFQPVAKKITGTWKWGLFPGTLYDTFDENNAILTVDGLLPRDLDPASGAWTAIGSYPAQIGLEVIIGTWPDINSTSVTDGSSMDRRVEYVSDGGTPPTYTQTYARIVLGRATDKGDGSPLLTSKPGDLQLYFTSATGVLSGGGTPQAVPCVFPF